MDIKVFARKAGQIKSTVAEIKKGLDDIGYVTESEYRDTERFLNSLREVEEALTELTQMRVRWAELEDSCSKQFKLAFDVRKSWSTAVEGWYMGKEFPSPFSVSTDRIPDL